MTVFVFLLLLLCVLLLALLTQALNDRDAARRDAYHWRAIADSRYTGAMECYRRADALKRLIRDRAPELEREAAYIYLQAERGDRG